MLINISSMPNFPTITRKAEVFKYEIHKDLEQMKSNVRIPHFTLNEIGEIEQINVYFKPFIATNDLKVNSLNGKICEYRVNGVVSPENVPGGVWNEKGTANIVPENQLQGEYDFYYFLIYDPNSPYTINQIESLFIANADSLGNFNDIYSPT